MTPRSQLAHLVSQSVWWGHEALSVEEEEAVESIFKLLLLRMGRRRSRWIWEMGIEDGEYKKAAPSAGERVYHNILDWIGLIFARQCSRVVTLTAVCTITIGLI